MHSTHDPKPHLLHLLGFLILMQQKVERLKQELAGHDEFDTRVAYLSLDPKNKGYVGLADLSYIVKGVGSGLSLEGRSPGELMAFFKRYGNGERMTYHDFLRELRPKNNLTLSQTLMVRNIVRKTLPCHLQQRFQLLIAYLILLACQSQRLKLQLQSHLGLNFIQIHELIRNDMLSQQRIHRMFASNEEEVTVEQVRYLVNHTREGRGFEEWTEQEIKEIFTPLDSQRMFESSSSSNSTNQYQHRQVNTQQEFRTTKKDNYLGVRFSRTGYGRLGGSEPKEFMTSRVQPETLVDGTRAINTPMENIDRFMRNQNGNGNGNRGLQESFVSEGTFQRIEMRPHNKERQLDRFIVEPGKKKQIEQFEDDLEQSQKSAFRYY